MSIMFLFAERFGRATAMFGTRIVSVTGALLAAAGLAWISSGAPPLPMWSVVAGTAVFGLGVSVSVATLTNAAVVAVPAGCAGAASGLNHAAVRAAGLFAVALLGSIAAPGPDNVVSDAGVQRAMATCCAIVGLGGVVGSALLRNEEPGGLPATESR
jgi:hypothetical protein